MEDEVKIRQLMAYHVNGLEKHDIWMITHHPEQRSAMLVRPESFTIHSNEMPVQINVNLFQLEALRQEILQTQKKLREKEGLTDAI